MGGGVVVTRDSFAMQSGPIYIFNTQCSNASSTTLRDCSFAYQTPDLVRSRCTHAQDVAVACKATDSNVTTKSFKATVMDPSSFNETAFKQQLADDLKTSVANIDVTLRGNEITVTVTGSDAIMRANHLSKDAQQRLGVSGFQAAASSPPSILPPATPEHKNQAAML